ncbi:MAG: hypothetical protein ACRD9Y_18195, partial [Blastocatellia bacterium]
MGVAALEPLVAALKYFELHMNQSAARLLGGIGDARAVKPLIAAFVRQREGGEKGYSLTNSILRSLEQLIEAKATEIAPEDLSAVAQFHDQSFSWEWWSTGYCMRSYT